MQNFSILTDEVVTVNPNQAPTFLNAPGGRVFSNDTCTEGSNPCPSARQSELQRKSALLARKYPKMPIFRDDSLRKRTGENGLPKQVRLNSPPFL